MVAYPRHVTAVVADGACVFALGAEESKVFCRGAVGSEEFQIEVVWCQLLAFDAPATLVVSPAVAVSAAPVVAPLAAVG